MPAAYIYICIYALQGKVTPIQLGESAKLRVGQQCLAVGNPFGFDHSLTTGVISGLNRDIASPAGGCKLSTLHSS